MSSPFDLKPQAFWPTTMFFRVWQDHPRYAPELIKLLYEMKRKESQNIASGVAMTAKSRTGLFESNFDLFAQDHPSLNALKGFVGQSIQQAVSHTTRNQVEPGRIRVEVVDSWFHITNDGGFHDAHFHSGCSWCGIYYLQAGDSSSGQATNSEGAGNGVNRFYSPIQTGAFLSDLGNAYMSSNRIDVGPRDGLMVLFPAYLLHSALAYKGETDRIVISFNTRSFPANEGRGGTAGSAS